MDVPMKPRKFEKQIIDENGQRAWEEIDPIDIKAGDAFRAWEGDGHIVRVGGREEFLAVKNGQSIGPNMAIVVFALGTEMMFSTPVAGRDY